MIQSFACQETSWLSRLERVRSIPPSIQRTALRKLSQPHAVAELAQLRVPPRRINEIVKGKRGVTADTALRLSRYFPWPAGVWLNLQSHFDRQIAEAELKPILDQIEPCPALETN
jgi:addiction module HigA family antidote